MKAIEEFLYKGETYELEYNFYYSVYEGDETEVVITLKSIISFTKDGVGAILTKDCLEQITGFPAVDIISENEGVNIWDEYGGFELDLSKIKNLY